MCCWSNAAITTQVFQAGVASLGSDCSPYHTKAHHKSLRWDGTQVVHWLRRWQVCRVTLALSTSFSPFEMHIHRLNACSASGKSVPTRVLELPFFPQSDFNCAVLGKLVRSHVAHTAVCANVKSDYCCVSKTNDSLSPKSSRHLKCEERWEGIESPFNMYGHEWYISGYYQNTNEKLR